MRKRFYLILLLALTLLAGGCLRRKSPVYEGPLQVALQVEWREVKPDFYELILSQGNEDYLLSFRGEETKLELRSGAWSFLVLGRNEKGQIVARGSQRLSLSKQNTVVEISLSAETSSPMFPAAENLRAAWLGEGIRLDWDTEGLPGSWLVWCQGQAGKLWRKIGSSKQAGFLAAGGQEANCRYAVSFLTPAGQRGPLSPAVQAEVAFLKLSWHFEHDFSFLPQATLRRPTALGFMQAGQFTDLIARFVSPSAYERRRPLLEEAGLRIKRELPSLWAVLVEPLDASRSLQEWGFYSQAEFYLEPNWHTQVERAFLPATTAAPAWSEALIRLPLAQKISLGSSDLRIAVLDSGLQDFNYPGVRVLPGYNFIGSNQDTSDEHGHGTQVAKIIGQVMPQVAIQPVKVLNKEGKGTDFSVAEGLLFAAGLHGHLQQKNPTPAQIINMSLGQTQGSSLMEDAVLQVAYNTDIIMVAAAGNQNQPRVMYPAFYPGVIAVGAVAPGFGVPVLASYSNYGEGLDLLAPGGSAEFPLASGAVGTSFAAPYVAGVAGLMLAEGISPQNVLPLLGATAFDVDGEALINAYWALQGPLSLRVLLLENVGGQWQPRQERMVSLGENETAPFAVPTGQYKVAVWLDLGVWDRQDVGDYYYETGPLFFGAGETVRLKVGLKEIKD